MIPKTIHYCWFGGGAIPEKDKQCINSWKRICPEYEIVLWNEDNYDVSRLEYMKQAYDCKKWGFVPDYARLDIIYNHGGIYLDTDVEIIKSFDELLMNKGFAGFEGNQYVALGLGFGAEKNNILIKKLMEQYENRLFIKEDGSLDTISSPMLSTIIFQEEGFIMNGEEQSLNGFTLYPTEVLCPMDYKTGKLTITENTRSIHWYNASWFTEIQRRELNTKRSINKLFGVKMGSVLFKVIKYSKSPKRLFYRLLYKDDVYYKEYKK